MMLSFSGLRAQTSTKIIMADYMGANTNVAAYDNKYIPALSKCVKWIREYHDWSHYEAENNYYKWDNITTRPQGWTWPSSGSKSAPTKYCGSISGKSRLASARSTKFMSMPRYWPRAWTIFSQSKRVLVQASINPPVMCTPQETPEQRNTRLQRSVAIVELIGSEYQPEKKKSEKDKKKEASAKPKEAKAAKDAKTKEPAPAAKDKRRKPKEGAAG